MPGPEMFPTATQVGKGGEDLNKPQEVSSQEGDLKDTDDFRNIGKMLHEKYPLAVHSINNGEYYISNSCDWVLEEERPLYSPTGDTKGPFMLIFTKHEIGAIEIFQSHREGEWYITKRNFKKSARQITDPLESNFKSGVDPRNFVLAFDKNREKFGDGIDRKWAPVVDENFEIKSPCDIKSKETLFILHQLHNSSDGGKSAIENLVKTHITQQEENRKKIAEDIVKREKISNMITGLEKITEVDLEQNLYNNYTEIGKQLIEKFPNIVKSINSGEMFATTISEIPVNTETLREENSKFNLKRLSLLFTQNGIWAVFPNPAKSSTETIQKFNDAIKNEESPLKENPKIIFARENSPAGYPVSGLDENLNPTAHYGFLDDCPLLLSRVDTGDNFGKSEIGGLLELLQKLEKDTEGILIRQYQESLQKKESLISFIDSLPGATQEYEG
ncbi:MAG: hypothetical protein ACTSU7_10190 [Candidatus Heimdallarchaeaceae archaeon]